MGETGSEGGGGEGLPGMGRLLLGAKPCRKWWLCIGRKPAFRPSEVLFGLGEETPQGFRSYGGALRMHLIPPPRGQEEEGPGDRK